MSLGENYGDFAFPAMIAAGAAVHLGLGERAVVIGEAALEKIEAMGTEGSEVRITLALGLCQTGRAEEALDAARPDARWTCRTAERCMRSPRRWPATSSRPPDDAQAVWDDGGSTYLDQIYVDVAAAAAEFHTGDTVSAELRLARAQAVAKRPVTGSPGRSLPTRPQRCSGTSTTSASSGSKPGGDA